MPKTTKELGPLEVKRLKEPGLHAVGGVPGLYLQVIGAARSWILRVMVGTKRKDIGLGGFPAVELSQARSKARAIRAEVAAGLDPVQERRRAASTLRAAQAAALTFQQAAERYIAIKSPEWRSEKHLQQVENSLKNHAYPAIGKLPVGDVLSDHIVALLEPIWLTKTETASRVRNRIEQVLDWATASGLRSGENPARWLGNLKLRLPSPAKVATVEHFAALPVAEVPAFMADLAERPGMSARALEFLTLTATRTNEVLGATWREIDLEAATWTIPGRRMKGKKEHRVPLSPQAVDLLKALPRAPNKAHVFMGSKNDTLSDMALVEVLRRMKLPAVPHGMRSSFRDWAAEMTSYPAQVCEMALAHALPDKVVEAYLRSDLLEKRVSMMKDWATFCASGTSSVERAESS